MRKLWCSLLLPLFLLLSQQGAQLHALAHALPVSAAHGPALILDRAADQPAPSDPDAPRSTAHALCGLCLAFDHLTQAVVSAPLALAPVMQPHAWASNAPIAWRAADSPTARSRDPPLVL